MFWRCSEAAKTANSSENSLKIATKSQIYKIFAPAAGKKNRSLRSRVSGRTPHVHAHACHRREPVATQRPVSRSSTPYLQREASCQSPEPRAWRTSKSQGDQQEIVSSALAGGRVRDAAHAVRVVGARAARRVDDGRDGAHVVPAPAWVCGVRSRDTV